uniref:Immunoglobulin V-set domain-containing protein n=1 Tax=Ursus americanus TaxID=9643 RepID=A0A452QA25_URSAM
PCYCRWSWRGVLTPTLITCSFSAFSLSTSGVGVAWVHQPPAMHWSVSPTSGGMILYYNRSLKSQLTISKDTSKQQLILTMTSMEDKNYTSKHARIK